MVACDVSDCEALTGGPRHTSGRWPGHAPRPHTHNRSPHTPCAVGGAKAERPGYSARGGLTCTQVAWACGVSTVVHMRTMWTTGAWADCESVSAGAAVPVVHLIKRIRAYTLLQPRAYVSCRSTITAGRKRSHTTWPSTECPCRSSRPLWILRKCEAEACRLDARVAGEQLRMGDI